MHQNVNANEPVEEFSPMILHTNQYNAEWIADQTFLWIVPLIKYRSSIYSAQQMTFPASCGRRTFIDL